VRAGARQEQARADGRVASKGASGDFVNPDDPRASGSEQRIFHITGRVYNSHAANIGVSAGTRAGLTINVAGRYENGRTPPTLP
jgi:hypothetical protein